MKLWVLVFLIGYKWHFVARNVSILITKLWKYMGFIVLFAIDLEKGA